MRKTAVQFSAPFNADDITAPKSVVDLCDEDDSTGYQPNNEDIKSPDSTNSGQNSIPDEEIEQPGVEEAANMV